MNSDNALSDSMVKRVISFVVAVILVAVVAIPIVNALTEENGSGGDDPEQQKTVINSWEDSTGLTSTKYKSYDVYIPSETPVLPHEISYTLDDIREMAETFTPVGDVEDISISFIEAYNNEQGLSVYAEGDDIQVHVPSTGTGIGGVESFTVNISTDYTVSYSLKMSDSENVLTGQFTTDNVLILSESEYGWERFDSDEKVAVGSKVILDAVIPPESESFTFKQIELTQDMFSDNQVQFTVDWGEGYHSDVTISITPDTIPGVSKVVNFTMEFVDGNGNPVEVDAGIDYLTTYGYVSSDNNTISSDDSDSGSGSGSDSMANTIIKLIPVFLVLGLLIAFALPMVQSKFE